MANNEFNFDAKVDFHFKEGSVLEIFRQPGVGKEVERHAQKTLTKAESMTPKSGFRNANYYCNSYIGGAKSIWRSRVNTGNPFSKRYNLTHNVLLKSMRG